MSSASIGRLLAACSTVLDRAVADHPGSLDGVDRAAAALKPPVVTRPIEARCLAPVASLLDSTVSFTAGDVDRELALAICGSADELYWRVAYPNHDEADMVALQAGYFVASIVGPKQIDAAPIFSEDVAIYITVMAPGLFYPSHVHKAPELYRVIAGAGQWQKGDGPFTVEPPGAWIVHPTGTRHAMETTDQPLLAMAIWTADLDSVPVIVRD